MAIQALRFSHKINTETQWISASCLISICGDIVQISVLNSQMLLFDIFHTVCFLFLPRAACGAWDVLITAGVMIFKCVCVCVFF